MYLLLSEHQMCNYYDLEANPGLKAKGKFIQDKFAYLDNDAVLQQLAQFRSADRCNVTLSLPTMHCASCVFLLENLHRLEPGIISSQTNFQRKDIFVSFNPSLISLRKVVELLSFIGYEPAISLENAEKKAAASYDKKRIYQLGVAGFCFSNIMMLSFPDYFANGIFESDQLKITFIWLSFALSLPVLFYSASSFFISGFKGLRQGIVNIDAPIALATLITFSRSYYEIFTHTGTGYLDSGSGIVFFMLIGRWFQDKTYDAISFDRNYRSFFPLGVTKLNNGQETSIPVTQLAKGDELLIRNEEMIPADAILNEGTGYIDYSFVSGESTPVHVLPGSLVYAGGKQMGESIKLTTVHEASQSYITQLWNNKEQTKHVNKADSFIHPWARHFTWVLFTVALGGFVYWSFNDPSRAFPALTSVLIVACPCTLLLTATFTYGNMLRFLGSRHLFLKNAGVIESIASINHVVFDKTGTITIKEKSDLRFVGTVLSDDDLNSIHALTRQSSHPLSRIISDFTGKHKVVEPIQLTGFKETSGQGIEAIVGNRFIRCGATDFVGVAFSSTHHTESGTSVHVSLDGSYKGYFLIGNAYREGLTDLANGLHQLNINTSVLSGDNDQERNHLQPIMGADAALLFRQSPVQKLEQIQQMKAEGKSVMMIGDGLNDAGALWKSDVGIAVSDDSSRFTPASDAIISGSALVHLPKMIRFARYGKTIITICFAVSIGYNIIGISYAVRDLLSPVVAAILMPISSITVVSLTAILSRFFAWKSGLNINT